MRFLSLAASFLVLFLCASGNRMHPRRTPTRADVMAGDPRMVKSQDDIDDEQGEEEKEEEEEEEERGLGYNRKSGLQTRTIGTS